MRNYGNTQEEQTAVGSWLCDYAVHREPFDNIKKKHTQDEVSDIAKGEYDWRIERGHSNSQLL